MGPGLTRLNSTTGSRGVMKMLMRTDPFRERERLTQQVFGTTTSQAVDHSSRGEGQATQDPDRRHRPRQGHQVMTAP